MFENRIDLSHVEASIAELKAEIRKVIVGQDHMIELLLSALLANGHVLIEGFPGLAKTLTTKILARTIDADFKRIQFTPDLMPSDVLGTSVFNFKTSEFDFKKGPIFTNIVLIDEINRAPAKTQAALFEVMEERQVSIDGTTYKMSSPFIIVATQNPIDLEGTYRLPEAQMDRFIYKIVIDYPSEPEEVQILTAYHEGNNTNKLEEIQKILSKSDIQKHQNLVSQVRVEEKLIQYIVQVVQLTRSYRDISIGASPRASLSILAGAKALAVLRGRDFVIPDDILTVIEPVLCHRITISPEKEMEGSSAGAVIGGLVKSIEIPR